MKRFNILLVFSALLLGFASCNEAEPFATAEAEDYPRILDPIFPDRQNGNLAEFNTHKRDANLEMALTVTPAAYTTVKWFIDGTEVHEGHSIDMNLPAGSYVLRMEATTMAGKSTYREGIVNVEPLDDDPYSEKKGIERVIAPGCPAVLIGCNLNSITGVVIGGRTIGAGSEDGEYLGYVVPEDLEEGEYRVELVDAEGNRFGANKVTVSTKPLIVDGFSRSTPGSEWVLSGINLETIKSFDISGTAITSFVRKSATEIVLTFPDLEEGEYSISALDADGYPAYFYYDGMEQSAAVVSVSGEKTLWEGHHYVSWVYEDGHPNKVFGFIS
ncbi:MAG: hypothetical protein HUJ91_03835, partial [Bacteroidales bacterium]|nr:hypothetical protein [Bacteroidales bacterium]